MRWSSHLTRCVDVTRLSAQGVPVLSGTGGCSSGRISMDEAGHVVAQVCRVELLVGVLWLDVHAVSDSSAVARIARPLRMIMADSVPPGGELADSVL